MNFYDRHVLPYLIDGACGTRSIQNGRAKLLTEAYGDVLEIGIGTGRNLPFYDRAKVSRLRGLDPAPQMHRLAEKRMRTYGMHADVMTLSAEHIPASDASFDTVVSTFTLCSIPDAGGALREMRRVLKPGGKLLFFEHGRAPDEGVRKWQDRLTPYWKPLAGGCHLNRDVTGLLDQAGFTTERIETRYLPGPKAMTYTYCGCARP
jgi:ubiquinone/menaquinone biosynthesis C-methylase UbiE